MFQVLVHPHVYAACYVHVPATVLFSIAACAHLITYHWSTHFIFTIICDFCRFLSKESQPDVPVSEYNPADVSVRVDDLATIQPKDVPEQAVEEHIYSEAKDITKTPGEIHYATPTIKTSDAIPQPIDTHPRTEYADVCGYKNHEVSCLIILIYCDNFIIH